MCWKGDSNPGCAANQSKRIVAWYKSRNLNFEQVLPECHWGHSKCISGSNPVLEALYLIKWLMSQSQVLYMIYAQTIISLSQDNINKGMGKNKDNKEEKVEKIVCEREKVGGRNAREIWKEDQVKEKNTFKRRRRKGDVRRKGRRKGS